MMKILISLLLLFSSLSWGLTFKDGKQVNAESNITYNISNPGLIFISKEDLKKNIQNSSDKNKACSKDRFAKYEDTNLIADKNLVGAKIGDQLFNQFGPILKLYCNYLLSEINQDKDKASSIKNEIKKLYLDLSRTKYLLNFHKDDNDDDHAYATTISTIPLLFVYSQFMDEFDQNQIKEINEMFIELVRKNEYGFFPEIVGVSAINNHGYYNNNYRLLVSIIANDKVMFNEAINYFLLQMRENETSNGLFKHDSKRGQCALHYNLHTLHPIMSTLWNLNLQNINFTNQKLNSQHSINDIVSIIIDAFNDPSIVIELNKSLGYAHKSAIYSCFENEKLKIGNEDIVKPYESTMWYAPYYALTKNQRNKDKFSNSSISNLHFYDSTSDQVVLSYFDKFIYFDPLTNEPISFEDDMKNKLLKELDF